jgi:NADH-quinone oxidoreductase subunit H
MRLEEWIDGILDSGAGLVGLDSPFWVAQLLSWIIQSVLLFSVVLTTGGLFTFVFRRLFAFFTQRIGPNRVGPFGLLQFLADGIKLLTKEDITPSKADKPLFRMAPYLAITPFVVAWAPLPFSNDIIFSNIGVGIIFILAISALSPLAEITAGWASNNKYSMYGGVRAAALDFSYEIPMVISALGVVILAGSLNTQDIVQAQRGLWFVVPQLIGAFIFFSAALAKAGLIPTDLPEAESEIVAGFTTEYSGMRFGLFYVVLFSQTFFIGALMTLLFLGGWTGPFWDTGVMGLFWFLSKTLLIAFLVFWLWLTLPRVRIDQYLSFAWKVLFPLSLVNLLIAGLLVKTGVL